MNEKKEVSALNFADKDELFRKIRESAKKYGNMPNELLDQLNCDRSEEYPFTPAPLDYDLLRFAIAYYKVI